MATALRALDEVSEQVDEVRSLYLIPEANYAKFERNIEKLSKKSMRLIGLPITPVVFGYDMSDDGVDATKIYNVYLTAETPKIDSWVFVARLDHSNDTGNVIRTVPNTGVEIPERYRTVAPNCDHCRVNRKRRDTFVLYSEDTGEFKQVGSSCLTDFFGHDPLRIARLAEYLGYAAEAARAAQEPDAEASSLNDHRYYNLEDFLGFAAKAVLTHGWVSGKTAWEDHSKVSTRETAEQNRAYYRNTKRNGLVQAEIDLAAAALEWAQGLADNPKNDYEHNVAVIANAIFIEGRSLGLAASIVGVYYMRLPKAAPVQTGRLNGLVDLLSRASLKSPKVWMTFDGRPLVLALAGPASKNTGSVYLTDGGPYGSNTYYGQVTHEGEFRPHRALDDKGRDALARVLTALSNQPAATASRFGHLTGRCCFCNQPLRDGRSTTVGYGPVCASTYSLPWGE